MSFKNSDEGFECETVQKHNKLDRYFYFRTLMSYVSGFN